MNENVWVKGAIIGGMWGILATPVYVIIGFRWWEKQTPYFVKELVPIIIYSSIPSLSLLSFKISNTMD
jgi:hypothetical protein